MANVVVIALVFSKRMALFISPVLYRMFGLFTIKLSSFYNAWGVWGVWGVRKYISFIALYFRLLILYIEYSGFLRISPICLVLLPKELAYGLKRNTPLFV